MFGAEVRTMLDGVLSASDVALARIYFPGINADQLAELCSVQALRVACPAKLGADQIEIKRRWQQNLEKILKGELVLPKAEEFKNLGVWFYKFHAMVFNPVLNLAQKKVVITGWIDQLKSLKTIIDFEKSNTVNDMLILDLSLLLDCEKVEDLARSKDNIYPQYPFTPTDSHIDHQPQPQPQFKLPAMNMLSSVYNKRAAGGGAPSTSTSAVSTTTTKTINDLNTIARSKEVVRILPRIVEFDNFGEWFIKFHDFVFHPALTLDCKRMVILNQINQLKSLAFPIPATKTAVMELTKILELKTLEDFEGIGKTSILALIDTFRLCRITKCILDIPPTFQQQHGEHPRPQVQKDSETLTMALNAAVLKELKDILVKENPGIKSYGLSASDLGSSSVETTKIFPPGIDTPGITNLVRSVIDLSENHDKDPLTDDEMNTIVEYSTQQAVTGKCILPELKDFGSFSSWFSKFKGLCFQDKLDLTARKILMKEWLERLKVIQLASGSRNEKARSNAILELGKFLAVAKVAGLTRLGKALQRNGWGSSGYKGECKVAQIEFG